MNNLASIWSTITEFDTGPMRAQVEKPFRVALLGADETSLYWLADALRSDPFTQTLASLPQTLWVYPLPVASSALVEAASAHLAVFVLPADRQDLGLEQEALQALRGHNARLPVVLTHIAAAGVDHSGHRPEALAWRAAGEALVDPAAAHPLDQALIPTLFHIFPEQLIALGHFLPGLRAAVAHKLINETSLSNATWVAGTGVAELVPILNIPLNMADMLVLTKTQALLAYKLALALGHDGDVQELLAPVAGVLGSGFLWRQAARSLVGLIPVIGLLPKIAVAYAGTYVTGHAVYAWYGRGQQLSPERMRELYTEAAAEARTRAAALLPARPASGRRLALPRVTLPRPALTQRRNRRCPNCGQRRRSRDRFCPHCGFDLQPASPQDAAADES